MEDRSETPIQRAIQEIIKHNGGFVFKMHSDNFTRKGIPDLISCIPTNENAIRKLLDDGYFKNNKVGLFFAVETKAEGKLNIMDTRRRAQEIVGKEIKSAGGLWYVSDDPELIEAIVLKIKGEL